MSDAFTARANLEAEECVLGIALHNREAAERFVSELTADDFYRPSHGAVFAAIVELHRAGEKIDTLTVGDVLRRTGMLDDAGGAVGLVAMSSNAPSALNAASYSAIVRREASARRLDQSAWEARQRIAAGEDPSDVAEGLETSLLDLDRGGRLPGRYWASWDDYAGDEQIDISQPLIPGMCNAHTRTILLAAEKSGKSNLMRMIAFCAAAGIHPFTMQPIEPVKVLILDAENDDDELVPTSERLNRVLGGMRDARPTRPALYSAPFGMDLRSRGDISSLEEVLEECRPQLIVGGPIYKLMPRREREDLDSHASALFARLDRIRRRWGCALLIEHHAPTGKNGEVRDIRSKGGQQYEAWPEVTVALHTQKNQGAPDSLRVKFRHPPRGKFVWPKEFRRGLRPFEFPWIPILHTPEGESAPSLDEAPVQEF